MKSSSTKTKTEQSREEKNVYISKPKEVARPNKQHWEMCIPCLIQRRRGGLFQIVPPVSVWQSDVFIRVPVPLPVVRSHRRPSTRHPTFSASCCLFSAPKSYSLRLPCLYSTSPRAFGREFQTCVVASIFPVRWETCIFSFSYSSL